MVRKNKNNGTEKFEEYYNSLYGQRWERLKAAMLKETKPILLAEDMPSPYYMDKASIIAAQLLPVEKNNIVLDMCAAPGGKTLVIARKLNGTGKLVSNDRSAQRRNRLIGVVRDCLTPTQASVVKICGYDSTKWSLHEKNVYDAVLLDAPCSSERHVVNDLKALIQWSPARPKQLAVQQYTMLAAAFDAVKPDGYILYSTCSINPLENSMIIERIIKKRSGRIEETDVTSINSDLTNLSEKQEYGRIILPDTQNGCGPLYFCLLRRLG